MAKDAFSSQDSAPTTWYAEAHLEEVDDAWTMDDPDAYREMMKMPWRPQSARLAEAEVVAGAGAVVETDDDGIEELTEAEITEVDGISVAEVFAEDDDDDVLATTSAGLSDEDISSVVSALAAELRAATMGSEDDGIVGIDDEGELVSLDELDLAPASLDDLDDLPGEALAPAAPTRADAADPAEDITDLDVPLVLVPGYSVQCEAPAAAGFDPDAAANLDAPQTLDRATPARIARRLWQRDIDRVAS